MKKQLLVALFLILAVSGISFGQIVFSEDFNYTIGTALSANGWTAATSGAGTNTQTVSTPGLTMANYWSTAAGAVALTTNGEDDYKAYTAQSSGSVYMSFLMNVQTTQANGDYFIAMSPATQYNYTARTFLKTSGSGFIMGISKSNEAATYGTTVFNLATTYLVVVKYTFNTTSTTDDVISLYVIPSISAGMTEPATPEITYLCADASKTDASTLEWVTLRQGSSSNAASLIIDGIRISTAWNGGVVVGIQKEEEGTLPNNFSLSQNYPNPFNPTTKISFQIPEAGNYSVKVFDILGKEVETLVNNEQLSAGKYNVTFNAKNLASGTYIYRLTGNNVNLTNKMLLVK
jgi:hypothetical protein